MTVVSSREFETNTRKYLDFALNQELYIQIGDNLLFVLNVKPKEPEMIFEPDDEFYESISMDELRESAHTHIEKLFASK